MGGAEGPAHARALGLKFLGIALSLLLVAILGFAGYEWLNGRASRSRRRDPGRGRIAGCDSHPATVAVTQQMQAVMQQHGATHVVSGVYGQAGRAALVVLLAQGPNIETTTTQFFTDFSSGSDAGSDRRPHRDGQHHGRRRRLHLLTGDRPRSAGPAFALWLG